MCSCSVHPGYLLSWNPFSSLFLPRTSRLHNFQEPTFLYVLSPYIKVTYFPGNHSLVCDSPVQQIYLLWWNPLSCMFLPCTSNLIFFLDPTLLYALALYIKFTYTPGTHSSEHYCSIHQGYLHAGTKSLVSMFLPRIALLTSWPGSTLLYVLAPYIKVNFLLEPTLLPYFWEPTHLHVLTPYIKASSLPETYFLACSCSVNQGNLSSQNRRTHSLECSCSVPQGCLLP